MEVSYEDAKQFGIMNTDETDKIIEFEEKPLVPKSNLASMGIYIFSWAALRQALIVDHEKHEDSDFGKHIIPMFIEEEKEVFAYRFNDYWKDIGTIDAYWEANIELTHTLPEFNLYDEFWKIYTNIDHQPPQFINDTAIVEKALLSEGCEISGKVYNSVIGPRVIIEEDAMIINSIIMQDTIVKRGTVIERGIVSEKCIIGENTYIGQGENTPHETKAHIYHNGITAIGAYTNIPENVVIGKNCEVSGNTTKEHYQNGKLESGRSLIV